MLNFACLGIIHFLQPYRYEQDHRIFGFSTDKVYEEGNNLSHLAVLLFLQAVNELALSAENYDESIVIVLSDANFDRYGISPTQFAKVIII